MNMKTIGVIIGLLNGILAFIVYIMCLYDWITHDVQPSNIYLAALTFNSACWIVLSRSETYKDEN